MNGDGNLTSDEMAQAEIDKANASLDRFEDALAYLDRVRGTREYNTEDAEHVHSILEGNA